MMCPNRYGGCYTLPTPSLFQKEDVLNTNTDLINNKDTQPHTRLVLWRGHYPMLTHSFNSQMRVAVDSCQGLIEMNTTENLHRANQNQTNQGSVVSIRSSVIDVQFPHQLPEMYSQLRAGEDDKIVIEVVWVKRFCLRK
ncbi:MAG: hypothetical protein RH949_30170 [Coleofasciculus sp. A1-SPW-01]|uniref:hypothetical protein n=1 Tax=Coleofasciculus sp. A1-SPW-01 TaxID=3070819 RepID=UPI0032F33892